jgi:putative oxidoreductase
MTTKEAAMLTRLLHTTPDPAAALARLTAGAVMFPHGAQHALGWFGGYGFAGTLGWMANDLGFPAPLAALAIVTELVAPLALIAGIGGRLAALGIVGIMLGALLTHAQYGFFMNWYAWLPAGQEGFEYHLVMIGLAGVVVLKGSGALSLDLRLGTAAHAAAAPSVFRRAA